MRRLIKYSQIGETSSYVKDQIKVLNMQKDKLLNTIDIINEAYQGKDADVIIEKYKGKTKIIEMYIKIIGSYTNGFDWLAGNYRDTHQKAIKNFTVPKK